jgi:hypothetical protein
MTAQYRSAVVELYSHEQYGISDSDVERHFRQTFETAYKQALEDLGAVLCRYLSNVMSASEPHARGGFGDVSAAFTLMTELTSSTTAPFSKRPVPTPLPPLLPKSIQFPA